MSRDEPGKSNRIAPSPWKVMIAQLFFGSFLICTGGWLSAEPSLILTKQKDGKVSSHYAFKTYKYFPVMEKHIDDLVKYDISESVAFRKGSNRTDRVSYNLVLTGRDGTVFAIGNAFDHSVIGNMLENEAAINFHEEKIECGEGRFYSGMVTGGIGAFIFIGGLWNLLILPLRILRK